MYTSLAGSNTGYSRAKATSRKSLVTTMKTVKRETRPGSEHLEEEDTYDLLVKLAPVKEQHPSPSGKMSAAWLTTAGAMRR
jgi:hypothetical protein